MISAMLQGFPLPISSTVPAIERTMWWRKWSAVSGEREERRRLDELRPHHVASLRAGVVVRRGERREILLADELRRARSAWREDRDPPVTR